MHIPSKHKEKCWLTALTMWKEIVSSTYYIHCFVPLIYFHSEFSYKVFKISMHQLAWELYGDEKECLIPNWVGTAETSELLNSLPLSHRIFWLPPNLQYTSFKYAFITMSADLSGMASYIWCNLSTCISHSVHIGCFCSSFIWAI